MVEVTNRDPLDTDSNTVNFSLEPFDNKRLANLAGQYDENIRLIEKQLHVTIKNRGNQFQISGEKIPVQTASDIVLQLYNDSSSEEPITQNKIHLYLRQKNNHETSDLQEKRSVQTKYAKISPRGDNQKIYLERILEHDINFAIGPAGTGKTYLAVACAVQALEKQRVGRILLVRPAVEAGERLGFLPGDLVQKIDPYLRPLYDALYEMIGFERVAKLLEKNIIEIAPLAYMRGRTLNDAFIILDESQNTTKEQMKMFLTRLGFNSIAVITGDITQIDLPRGVVSGLRHSLNVLQGVPGISVTEFLSKDVVRHPLVQKIVEAYSKFEKNQEGGA